MSNVLENLIKVKVDKSISKFGTFRYSIGRGYCNSWIQQVSFAIVDIQFESVLI